MDIITVLQIVVLLGAIFLGVRMGGIGIGYAGGIGVLILGLCLDMKPGNIPRCDSNYCIGNFCYFGHATGGRTGLSRSGR